MKNKIPERRCRQCREIFTPTSIYKGRGNFCSRKCVDNSRRRNGISKRCDGYISVWKPSHPRANQWGWVYEHVLVAGDALGRLIKSGEIVHHKNGNPSDNSPENLEVFKSQADHMKRHAEDRIREKGGSPGIKKACSKCEKIKFIHEFSKSSSRGKERPSSQCKECVKKWQLEFRKRAYYDKETRKYYAKRR